MEDPIKVRFFRNNYFAMLEDIRLYCEKENTEILPKDEPRELVLGFTDGKVWWKHKVLGDSSVKEWLNREPGGIRRNVLLNAFYTVHGRMELIREVTNGMFRE